MDIAPTPLMAYWAEKNKCKENVDEMGVVQHLLKDEMNPLFLVSPRPPVTHGFLWFTINERW